MTAAPLARAPDVSATGAAIVGHELRQFRRAA
jgi:hypothetical protein